MIISTQLSFIFSFHFLFFYYYYFPLTFHVATNIPNK